MNKINIFLILLFILPSLISALPIDFPQTPVLEASGLINSEGTGYSVDFMEDINNDGIPEIISGAPASTIVGAPGHVYLFDGATGDIINSFTNGIPNDNFGFSVAALGDLNGNSVQDFAVASFNRNYVYEANGNLLYTIFQYGHDVANAGDLTNDGINDILVGTSTDTYVYNGASGALITVLPAGGFSVDSLKDITNDGVPEILSGDPYDIQLPYPPGGATGKVYLYNGANFNLISSFSTGIVNDLYGASVADAGDYNGDGIQDIVIGAPSPSTPGKAYVYSGSNFAQLAQFVATPPTSLLLPYGQFGISVDGGDFNKDGFSDIIVGANMWSTPALGIGKVELFLGPNGVNAYTWPGASNFNNLGWSIATRDFNGDGFSDFASCHLYPQTTPGSAVVHSLGGAWNYGSGPLSFVWQPTAGVPGTGSVVVSGGTPNAPLYLALGDSPASVPISPGNNLYVNPNSPQFGVLYLGNLDSQGNLIIQGVNLINPTFAGFDVYLQVGAYTGGPTSNLQLSNGLHIAYVP
ncbi:MAG: hypothetical protein FJZ43_03900 [Candidatus Staskawiczbacteria bacterium]|nr:hypothetical protein [Candidatus Staskawiczbacteria bacterium]